MGGGGMSRIPRTGNIYLYIHIYIYICRRNVRLGPRLVRTVQASCMELFAWVSCGSAVHVSLAM